MSLETAQGGVAIVPGVMRGRFQFGFSNNWRSRTSPRPWRRVTWTPGTGNPAAVGIVDARFLAPASEIARALGGELAHGAFWTSLGQTLPGWAEGLAIAMAAGVVVGAIVGSVPVLRSR
ncbi:hypothetical protein [Amycolatopsis thermoflava]|uniref:hypothetical protein n=1 Tax=Amycolatopsis thermoflava TaxID=84480 RepID=UPI00365791C8